MTELTFLVDLLLNHRLPKATKDAVASRIREVEENLACQPQGAPRPRPVPPALAGQSPSTIANMTRGGAAPEGAVAQPEPVPVAVVAQNAATAQALAARQQALQDGPAARSIYKAKPK